MLAYHRIISSESSDVDVNSLFCLCCVPLLKYLTVRMRVVHCVLILLLSICMWLPELGFVH
jgi:hypothetical protein